MKFALSLLAAATLAAVTPAHAVSVVHQTGQGSYTTNVFGGSQWTVFTAMFDAAHSRSAVGSFADPSVPGYDAAWGDQELGNTLSGAEVSALMGFIGSGHKAVLVGENYSWAGWNTSLMAVVSGTHTDDCSWSVGSPLVSGLLTGGVASVQNTCGSTLGSGGGAQILFSNAMAALYKVGAGEALVIMDSNWNDNTYMVNYDNRRFAENVIAWLGAPIPEPGTYALMLAGLGALGIAARRRRS